MLPLKQNLRKCFFVSMGVVCTTIAIQFFFTYVIKGHTPLILEVQQSANWEMVQNDSVSTSHNRTIVSKGSLFAKGQENGMLRKDLIYYGSNESLFKKFNTEKMRQKYGKIGMPSQAKRFPRCICPGTAKSGTAAVRIFLNLHPQVVDFNIEPDYFLGKNYHRNYEKYLEMMPYSAPQQLTYEASPGYTDRANWKEIPARIYDFDPTVKILMVVRNPVDKAFSFYYHFKNKRTPPFESLAIKHGTVEGNYRPIFLADYSRIFKAWLKFFKLHQIHIVDGDKLIDNPASELKKVEDFLQIPRFFNESKFYFNTSKKYYCFRSETFTQCLPPRKGHRHNQLGPKVRQTLLDYFKPYNEEFFQMVGRRFNWTQ